MENKTCGQCPDFRTFTEKEEQTFFEFFQISGADFGVCNFLKGAYGEPIIVNKKSPVKIDYCREYHERLDAGFDYFKM